MSHRWWSTLSSVWAPQSQSCTPSNFSTVFKPCAKEQNSSQSCWGLLHRALRQVTSIRCIKSAWNYLSLSIYFFYFIVLFSAAFQIVSLDPIAVNEIFSMIFFFYILESFYNSLLKFFYNFDILKVLTICDNSYNYWHFWQFLTIFFTILTILNNFEFFVNNFDFLF